MARAASWLGLSMHPSAMWSTATWPGRHRGSQQCHSRQSSRRRIYSSFNFFELLVKVFWIKCSNGLECLGVRCMHQSKTFTGDHPLMYVDKTSNEDVGIRVLPVLRRPLRKGTGNPGFPPSCLLVPNHWHTTFKDARRSLSAKGTQIPCGCILKRIVEV